MCGGAAFVKLMKKTNCLASSTKKDYGPRITSSSSFTSQESSNIEYDPPPKAQFRMPNQIGEPVEEAYKLDFRLQAEEHSEFLYDNKNRGNIMFLGGEPQTMIKLNPQVVNQLKTKHLQSLNGGFSANDSAFDAFGESQKQNTIDNEDITAKTNSLHREIREELRAIRKSLPNQFEINFFDSADEQENMSPEEKLDFKQYFKNDWNLSFHDQDDTNKEDANKSDTTQTTVMSSDISRSALEPEGNFPDFPEMPFEKEDLNPQQITPANSTSPDDKEQEHIDISPKSKLELERILKESGIVTTNTEDNRSSSGSSSQFEEDMKLVKMLLRKYGNTITDKEEQRRFDRARRLHAIVNPPSDKWFHRHAAGMCLTPEKLSPSLPAEEEISPIQAPPMMPSPPIAEKPKETIVTKAKRPPAKKTVSQVAEKPKTPVATVERSPQLPVTPKPSIVASKPTKSIAAVPQKRIAAVPQKPKSAIATTSGRSTEKKTVHFKEPAVAQSVTYEVTQKRAGVTALKITPGLRTSVDDCDGNTTPTRRSPGRLSAKVQYWEHKKF